MLYSNKLKEIRERIGNTQEELANILGMTKSGYCRFENEKEIMPLKHLVVVCDFYNISLDYVFGLNSKSQTYPNLSEGIFGGKFCNRLKSFRKENKITQVQLATALHTVHPVITNYEKGKNLIDTYFLYILCKKYGISADYLLGRIDEPIYWDKEKESEYLKKTDNVIN